MTAPLVSLRAASVRLGWRTVLDSLDLDVVAGGHLAIRGGNGSGKTTLLRLLAGELWPTPAAAGGKAGERIYDFGDGPEHDAVGARARVRLVGPELQDRYTARGLNLPAWQVVASGLDDGPLLRRRLTAAERRQLDKCLLRTGTREFGERPFLFLSRGEQRRVLVARALMPEPALLCLDETGDGLDGPALAALLALLDRLAGPSLTLVMATHHGAELPAAIRRRLALVDGRLVDAAGPAPPAVIAGTPVVPDAPESGGEPLIAVTGASVYRARRRVLKALEFRLRPGERWLLGGRNGAGKSTFLKLLHGDLRPARGGAIAWFGLPDPPDLWAVRERLGFVSDELQARHQDSITVADCVATGFVSSIGRVPVLGEERRQAVDRWLATLGLSALRERPIRALSYGQFRRVLLARALVKSPAVLLLDEPASGLDPESRALLRRTLERAAAAGIAMVAVSHRGDLGGVGDGLWNRGGVIDGGALRPDAAP